MPRNIEVKARIASVESLSAKAFALADQGPIDLTQDDTFFNCENGRLKLRVAEAEGELIFYRRVDEAGPKESYYFRSPASSPDTLRDALTLAYGQAGRVRKRRTLFLVGRTRLHLDRVSHLGDFLELEVVLGDGESAEGAIEEAHLLLAKLGVESSQLVKAAYVDLLAERDT